MISEYGELQINLEKILADKGISKNQICKDMDIPRSNFNRYCRNDFQRLDASLLCKLCFYLNVELGDLLVYKRSE